MILIDSHVHIYESFPISDLFNSAIMNFSSVTAINPIETQFVLFLTEGEKQDYFSFLLNLTGTDQDLVPGWRIINTCENHSIIVESELGQRIFIIQGSQIVTKEKLEVLSIGTRFREKQRFNITDTVNIVTDAGGIAIIPWGFGKWFGRRGKLLYSYLSSDHPLIFLGDNGGRSGLLPYPRLFRYAKKNKLTILPGSDPLPLKKEEKRAGSFGFILEGNLDNEYPANDLKQKLIQLKSTPESFGNISSPLSFIKKQTQLRIQKYK